MGYSDYIDPGHRPRTAVSLTLIGLFISLFVIFIAGCEGAFSLDSALRIDTGNMAISPNSATMSKDGTLSLNITGGVAPYAWSIISGPGSLLGPLDAAAIEYDPAGVTGTAMLQAADSGGHAIYSVILVKDLDPLALLAGTTTLGVSETLELFAVGGNESYAFDITVNNSGDATVSAAGLYKAGSTPGIDTVRVTDGLGATQIVDITVVAESMSIPDVSYSVTTVSSVGPALLGTMIDGSFIVTNNGTDTGTDTVEWQAFVSTTPDLAGVVGSAGSGSFGGLGSGLDSMTIPVMGSWPDVQGSYYLVVHVSAPVDGNLTDNVGAAPAINVNPRNVDYVSETAPTGGDTHLVGSTATESFKIRNQGTDDGISDVEWIAWISADSVPGNTGDVQMASGTLIGGLTGETASSSIDITGTWPLEIGTFNLIVTWHASDDTNLLNNQMTATGTITLKAPESDYAVVSVGAPGGALLANDAVNGSFTVQNIGPDDDTEGFAWTVYASSDMAYNAGDAYIASGTGTAQTVMATPLVVNYAGSWPETGGDYHVIAIINSVNDQNAANDEGYDATGPSSVVNATDYEISSVTYHGLGTPGAALSAAPTPPLHSDYTGYDFIVSEIGGVAGSKKIDYAVYASTDTILDIDAGDTLAFSGFLKALDVGASGSTAVNFEGGTWPSFPGIYYLIITINAADDVKSSNDIYVAGPIQVGTAVLDTEPNDDSGPFTTAPPNLPTNFTDVDADLPVGALRPNELFRVDGVMEAAGAYDTFGFTAGTGMTSMEVSVEWAGASNDADLYVWNETGAEVDSIDTIGYKEGPMTIVNLIPGARYYVSVLFNTTGPNYGLTVMGRP